MKCHEPVIFLNLKLFIRNCLCFFTLQLSTFFGAVQLEIFQQTGFC